MSKILMPLRSVGKGGALRLRARLLRQEQMESWVDTPEKGTRWIPLGKGKRTLVDEDMFEHLHQWNWYCSNWGYAVRFVGRKCIRMNSIIIKIPKGKQCDHRDRDRLNNRRENLRPCTKLQNQGNRWKPNVLTTSKFKGVSLCKRSKKFVAYGREGKVTRRLGAFDNEIDAAKAYNNWAEPYFGKFAYLNSVCPLTMRQ